MATESLAPTGQVAWVNLSGSYLVVDDDPDSPTNDWADTTSQGADTTCHVSFPAPSGDLSTGANLQTFKAWIRKSRNNTPQCRIDVYEGGVLKASGTLTDVDSTIGEMKTFTWDASVLTDVSGAGVECRIFGDGNTGAPKSNTSSVEIDAVEWDVVYEGVSEYYHGLKVEGVGELALCDVGSNPLRVRKGGTTYGIELVATDDLNASPMRIKTGAGTKALRLIS